MGKIDINLDKNSYPIYIEDGLLDNIGSRIREGYKGKKTALVTDENVNNLYGNKILNELINEGYEVKLIVLPSGEKTKSVTELVNLYNNFLDFEMTRSDLIIAFGGGVIGDLTGFAAATFLRGINFLQIPTSLMAQIDSSIGGKTAIDLPRGKNLVGSFYQPKAVFIDPLLLRTLDKRFLYDGMAEVIKYGAIKDRDLFDNLMSYKGEEELFYNMKYVIETCCNIKKFFVENDEKDTGQRMILNFGHTIGHAVEKYFNYEKYTHGEAVAIGMYSITCKSELLGLTAKGTSEKIKDILIKYKLPFEIEVENKQSIINAVYLDKKNMGSSINIILLRDIGKSFIKTIERTMITDFI